MSYNPCNCKECQNLERHFNHPFYKKVDEVTTEIAKEQIRKGAEKYPEPFDPKSWTNKELVVHLLQELRDGQVYGVGLLQRLEDQEAQIKEQQKHIEFLKAQNEFWRLRLQLAEKGGK